MAEPVNLHGLYSNSAIVPVFSEGGFVWGTASYIGPNQLLTSGHVSKELLEQNLPIYAGTPEGGTTRLNPADISINPTYLTPGGKRDK